MKVNEFFGRCFGILGIGPYSVKGRLEKVEEELKKQNELVKEIDILLKDINEKYTRMDLKLSDTLKSLIEE